MVAVAGLVVVAVAVAVAMGPDSRPQPPEPPSADGRDVGRRVAGGSGGRYPAPTGWKRPAHWRRDRRSERHGVRAPARAGTLGGGGGMIATAGGGDGG